MRALVTGAGGFLGRYIVEQSLARGDTVRGIGRGHYPELEKLGIEFRRVDIHDREATVAACEGVAVVYHVAAIAGIWGPWAEFYDINVTGTRNVLEGCRRHGVKRLVFTSSPSVTFDGQDQSGIDESVGYSRRWLCHYAQTKALAEQAVLAANGRDGLSTCALRPHLIWGPRDTQLVPRLIARAKSGRLRQVGDGRNLIDTIYVENAAAAHLKAADALAPGSPVCGRAYFITQNEPVNCWSWINQLLEMAGLPPVKKRVSAQAAWRLGGALEGVYRLFGWMSEPPMTRFLAAQLARHHYYLISAARRDFGYHPEISTAEGLRRTLPDLLRWAQA